MNWKHNKFQNFVLKNFINNINYKTYIHELNLKSWSAMSLSCLSSVVG